MEYKSYQILGDGTFGMYLIKPKIGILPEVLKGAFTKQLRAKEAIDAYVQSKQDKEGKPEPIKKVKLEPREVKDGAAEGSSGD